MHFLYKPSITPVSPGPASHRPIQASWVSLEGKDAKDFLHRLTTVNVRNLIPGEGAEGCFLTAQGKLRALFTLWNYGEDAYGFELDAGVEGGAKKELLAAIDQYTFSEKFTLTDVTALEALWIFPENEASFLSQAAVGAPSLKAGQTMAINEEIRLCHQGTRAFGRPWITAWGRGPRLAQWRQQALSSASTLSLEDLENWRIQSLRPRVAAEIDENTIPLELGLTEAISDNKGCYPGQEVIERIVSLGSPARRLALLEGTLTEHILLEPGATLKNAAEPPADVGVLTSIAPREDGKFIALALIRKIHAKEGLELQTLSPRARAQIVRIAPYSTHSES